MKLYLMVTTKRLSSGELRTTSEIVSEGFAQDLMANGSDEKYVYRLSIYELNLVWDGDEEGIYPEYTELCSDNYYT